MANIMRIGGGGGEKPELTVTAPTGSTVVCTKGTKTVTAQETDGVWLFKLPEFGEWTVSATKDGESASDTVDVQQDYSVTLSYKPTASLTPTSGVTYTNGISALTAEQMSLYGETVSNNASITSTTSEVYVDDGASHYKISVGDSINLTVSSKTYEFVVIGFNHDELTTATAYGAVTATGKAGFTLQMKNCLTTTYKMNAYNNNSRGWDGCDLRATLQSTIKGYMDSAWQTVTKTVKKPASAGSQSATIVTSDDTLFLLSEIEIFGSITHSKSGEGSQYAWYSAGNTKVKFVGSSAHEWSERSPGGNYSTSFCYVTDTGTVNVNIATSGHGCAFAFCI